MMLSFIALVVLSPLMAVIAVCIRLTSAGPALFLQERTGLYGRPFRMIKFRSMVVGAEQMGAGYGMEKDDPRITPVGRWLRATSFDELPQLWNILIGDMSIVGPRPGLPYQAANYTQEQARRLDVRPGITGWAQIHGRNEIPWSRRIQLDLWYVDSLSFGLDLSIVCKTILVVLSGSGFRQDQLASDVEDFGIESSQELSSKPDPREYYEH
jgi:lipopolysaccharide/colanic/teichoic acid biosynthesis glycosyltransferase